MGEASHQINVKMSRDLQLELETAVFVSGLNTSAFARKALHEAAMAIRATDPATFDATLETRRRALEVSDGE